MAIMNNEKKTDAPTLIGIMQNITRTTNGESARIVGVMFSKQLMPLKKKVHTL